jgi:hypothetical protein
MEIKTLEDAVKLFRRCDKEEFDCDKCFLFNDVEFGFGDDVGVVKIRFCSFLEILEKKIEDGK